MPPRGRLRQVANEVRAWPAYMQTESSAAKKSRKRVTDAEDLAAKIESLPDLDWDLVKAIGLSPQQVLDLQHVAKEADEAKSAFAWIATEIEAGTDPQRLRDYARLYEQRLAAVLDDLKKGEESE